jgi:tetratricopeptide (TPR) repeat protein
VYDTLLPTLKQELHERVGRAIEELWSDRLEEVYELLAQHYAKSRDADRAVDYLERASGKAMAMNAMIEAKGFFLDAMRLLDTLPATRANRRRRVALVAEQRLSFFLLYQLEEYYQYLTRFEALVHELEERNAIDTYYGSMALCEWSFGNFGKAIHTAGRAIDLRSNVDDAADLMSYAVIQWSNVDSGEFEAVLTFENDAEQASFKSTDLRSHLYCLGAVAFACAQTGRFDRALEVGNKISSIAGDIGDRSAMSYGAWITAWARVNKGDISRGLDAAIQAAQLAPTTADQSWAQGTLALAHCRAGNASQAIEILSRLIPAYRAARFLPAEIFSPYLGEAYWRAGNIPMALQAFEEMLAIIEPRRMRLQVGIAHRLLGEIHMTDDTSQAITYFEQSVTLLKAINALPELARAYVAYGRLYIRLGKVTEAQTYLVLARDIFKRLDTMNEVEGMRAEFGAVLTV